MSQIKIVQIAVVEGDHSQGLYTAFVDSEGRVWERFGIGQLLRLLELPEEPQQ